MWSDRIVTSNGQVMWRWFKLNYILSSHPSTWLRDYPVSRLRENTWFISSGHCCGFSTLSAVSLQSGSLDFLAMCGPLEGTLLQILHELPYFCQPRPGLLRSMMCMNCKSDRIGKSLIVYLGVGSQSIYPSICLPLYPSWPFSPACILYYVVLYNGFIHSCTHLFIYSFIYFDDLKTTLGTSLRCQGLREPYSLTYLSTHSSLDNQATKKWANTMRSDEISDLTCQYKTLSATYIIIIKKE